MTRPLALVICAAWLLFSPVAAARPKVALTPIEGDASGDVREAVLEALEGKELSLISGKVVNRAVDKLGEVGELTDRDWKKLANELEADAIIVGKLEKVGGSKRLKFRLFVDRKPAKGFMVSFKNARSEKFRTLLHDKMLDRLGVSAATEAEPEAEAEERPAKKAQAGEDDEDPLAGTRKGKKSAKKAKASSDADKDASSEEDARPTRKAKPDKLAEEDAASPTPEEDAEARPRSDDESPQGSDDEADAPRRSKKVAAADDDEEEDDEDVDTRVSVVAASRHGANRIPVRVNLGVSLVQRTFTFNSRSFDNQPTDVSLSPVPGARLEAEIYPLALGDSTGALAGLGFAAEYDRTLKLNIRKTGVTAPAKQGFYSIGLRYRLAFGKTETSPTLTLGVGYGKRLFSVDLADAMDPAVKAEIRRDTPESEYTVIDPGVQFRIPLTRMVAFSLGGRGMIITDGGPVLKRTSYGQAKVYGAEGLAAFDVVLGRRFALRLSGEFVQVGFQFKGVGELSNNLDGDPATKDVGGLADRSLGGSATFSVLY